MVTTLLLAIAAWVGLNSASAKPMTMWHTDYNVAKSVAADAGKPMAVFLGQGITRLERMMQDGTIPEEAARLLREHYVVVALDVTTTVGRDLATRYSMREGLIINDWSGSVQALRHGGAVAGAGLTAELLRYAQVADRMNQSTQATKVNGVVGGTFPNGRCTSSGTITITNSHIHHPGIYTTNSISAYRNAMVPNYYPYNLTPNGCPNGRCPNQR